MVIHDFTRRFCRISTKFLPILVMAWCHSLSAHTLYTVPMQFSCYLNDNEAFAIYSFCSMIDSPFATRTCNSEQQRAETSLKRILTFPLSKALKKCEFDPPLQMNFRQKVRSTWYSSSPFCQRIFSALREWWWHLGGLWEKKKKS